MRKLKRISCLLIAMMVFTTQPVYAADGNIFANFAKSVSTFFGDIGNTIQSSFEGILPSSSETPELDGTPNTSTTSETPELNDYVSPPTSTDTDYIVRFFGNGGTLSPGPSASYTEGISNSSQVDAKVPITDPTIINVYSSQYITTFPTHPTRDDVIFAGWAPHNTSHIIRTTKYTITDSVILDAIWKTSLKDSYTITYNPEQGNFPGFGTGVARTEEVTAGQFCTGLEIPQRSGHTFIGWRLGGESSSYTEEEYVEPTVTIAYSDLTFYAVWDDTTELDDGTFYVVCDANGGTFESIGANKFTIHYSLNVADTAAETPTREGYTFNGWTLDKYSTSGIFTEYPRPTYPDSATHNTVDTAYVYYAAWVSNSDQPNRTISITWQPNGGTFGEIFDYNIDDTTGYATKSVTITNDGVYSVDMTTAPIVTRTDYVLKGWSLTGNDNVYTGSAYNTSSSVTFVAIWEEYNESAETTDPTGNSYSVTFNANGGTFSDGTDTKSQMVAARGVANVPENPTYTAHVFKGWAESSTATTPVNVSTLLITGNKVFYAVWGLEDVGLPTRVTLIMNGGTYSEKGGTVNVVATVGTPISQFYTLAARSGYTLKGFSAEPDSQTVYQKTDLVTADMVLYAVWLKDDTQITTHTITFNGNGGYYNNGRDSVVTVSVNDGEKLSSIPKPTLSGATFLGYNSSSSADTVIDLSETTFTADAVYYAVWQIDTTAQFTVYFIAGDGNGGSKFDDGSQQKTVTVGAGTKVTAPETPRETRTMTFNYWSETKASGWSGNSTPFDFNTTIKKNTTLYAIYKNQDNSSKFRTVTFKYNGGKLRGKTSVSVDVLSGYPVSEPEEPKRSGYKFKGWYTDDDEDMEDEDKWDFADPINEDLTLYAYWKAKTSSSSSSTTSTTSSTTSAGSTTATPTSQAAQVPTTEQITNTTPNYSSSPVNTGQYLDANGNLVDANGNLIAANSVPRTGIGYEKLPQIIMLSFIFMLGCIVFHIRRKKQED